MPDRFRSLRRRLVVPLLAVSACAAIVIAIASYFYAAASTESELASKFESIRQVVDHSNFPLTRNVLVMLSDLTSADWFAFDEDGKLIESSLTDDHTLPEDLTALTQTLESPLAVGATLPASIRFNNRDYQAIRIRAPAFRLGSENNSSRDVIVMLDDSHRKRDLLNAAIIPLLTGISTIALLTTLSLWLVERLIKRIRRLQVEVDGIASGNFNHSIEPDKQDELGLLSDSVSSMARQLDQMWLALQRQHGQQLLHQISGGLAHNLRNTLTGARMAVELAQRRGLSPASEAHANSSNFAPLSVAMKQLEQAEDYVQRLLLASRGKEARNRPTSIRECLEGLRPGLENTAQHRGVKLIWTYAESLIEQWVQDGPTLVAAVSNLVWNAIEASEVVTVNVNCDPLQRTCCIEVIDCGPGPKAEVADTLFDPFVSTKSEGLGLGLPLVRRAAEALHGEVQWKRVADQTVFMLTFPICDEPKQ